MGAAPLMVALAIAASGIGQAPAADEIKTQNEVYSRWWNTELNWKFSELPEKGNVPAFRVPRP